MCYKKFDSNKSNLMGILNVIKPPDMTSFDVVSFLRNRLGIKRVGHTGTLDPMAVGVLPICIGKSTKLMDLLVEKDKVYRTELILGKETTTQDFTGEVINHKENFNIDNDVIINTIKSFEGEIFQIPPMYSAVKVKGKRLYELARKGIEIERKPRKINIYNIDIKLIKGNRIMFDVHCSKGTYIRTLCNDIGKKLGVGGYLNFLHRTKSGNFDINSAYTLQEIIELITKNEIYNIIVDPINCFEKDKLVELTAENEVKFKNGGFIEFNIEKIENKDILPIAGSKNNLIGLGYFIIKGNKMFLRPKRIL